MRNNFGQFTSNKSLIQRFEEKIYYSLDGCWYWIGATINNNGSLRGSFYFNGKPTQSSRVAYEIYKGKIENGLHVLHTCDNGLCVNPYHLYIGTHQQNMDDRENRNRGVRQFGISHPMAKLTRDQVNEIRNGLRTKDAIKKFRVCRTTVKNIRNGKIWKSIS